MKLHNFPKHLRIAVFPYEFNWKPAELTKSEIESSILHGFLLELLSETLKFSFELKNNTEFGHTPEDGGNWTGCIGMVRHGEADIAVCSLSCSDIDSGLSYSIPYLYTAVRFVTDKPKPVPNRFAIFYSLSWHIWMTLSVFFLLVSLFFYFFFRRKYNYPYVLFQVFASLFEQSFNLKFRAISGRVLTFSWIIGAMFISYSYKAVLLASISFPNVVGIHNIKELSEAAQNPSFKCGTYVPNEQLRQRLNNPSVESFTNVYNCMKRTPQPWDVNGFTLNTSYKKAFLNIDYYLTEFEKDMFLSDDSFFSEMFAVPVNQRFCCLRELNDAIYRIIESGLIEKFVREREFFMGLHVNATNPNNSPNRILILDDLFGAFMILIGGLVLSTFVFMLEIIFHKKAKLKKISVNLATVEMGLEEIPFMNVAHSSSVKGYVKVLHRKKTIQLSSKKD